MKFQVAKNGFTLLEMTVVILVLLTLMGTGLYVSNQYQNWQLGRNASENLRMVHAAQRQYLADNPTVAVSSITAEVLIPYLSNRAAALPTIEALDGSTLTIDVTVNPPVIDDGNGGAYDPSGSTEDSLWDAGK